MLLEKVSLNDQSGYLYVVDIEFDHTKATKTNSLQWTLPTNYQETKNIFDPCERSVYQLIE